ncbi:hypothetical protein DDZ14_08455 [Maritimibacter sp. 55A14]|uniref:hypothetical protein n=1 Tax=Maritimibacter sp. 55A14 TaxID=2174844 RepID=UPI000D604D81|nr:hypothetical protein [Maritimibacter sp. 55A14]PWE32768.1 hypothetical protein DDZ14_08455 [Maritimibacter sp. 55A14]
MSVARLSREDRDRVARDEAMRLAALARDGSAPAVCGPALVRIAPARGLLIPWMPRAQHQGADGEHRAVDDGFDGRHAARVGDAFDRMQDAADRAAGKGRVATPLFTPGQVAMGRYYRTLKERHASAGVRGQSLETVSGGGGSGGEFIDAVLMDRQRIAAIEARVGSGMAMVMRRMRPSDRGSRAAIPDMRLVAMVCLEDQSIGDVLRAFGWSIKAETRAKARAALCSALDRMQGYVEARPQHRA